MTHAASSFYLNSVIRALDENEQKLFHKSLEDLSLEYNVSPIVPITTNVLNFLKIKNKLKGSDSRLPIIYDLILQVSIFSVHLKKIKQSFAPAFRLCVCYQDLRDILPDVFLTDDIRDLQLSRIVQPGDIVKHDPDLHRQFMQALEYAYIFKSNELLYS